MKALDLLKHKEIDVLLTDVLMPKISGLQLLSSTKKLFPATVRIVLTMPDDSELGDLCKHLAHGAIREISAI